MIAENFSARESILDSKVQFLIIIIIIIIIRPT